MIAMIGFLIRFRKWVLIIMGVATLFFIVGITRMEMFTRFLDLFPSSHPYVQIHKEYEKFFGGAYQATLVLEVKNGDVFNIDTLAKMDRIQSAVDLITGVVYVFRKS